MPETILTSVKLMLGLQEDYAPFDVELVHHINSVLMILDQLGIGRSGYRITLTQVPVSEEGAPVRYTSNETWNDFLGTGYTGDKEAVKSYVAKKVKLLFDPPASGTLMESANKLNDEMEFRLLVAAGV